MTDFVLQINAQGNSQLPEPGGGRAAGTQSALESFRLLHGARTGFLLGCHLSAGVRYSRADADADAELMLSHSNTSWSAAQTRY